MKKYIYIIIFTSTLLHAQKKEKVYYNYDGIDYLTQEGFLDKKGKKTKEWIAYYNDFNDNTKTESTQIKSITTYKDGVKNGLFTSFYPEGKIKEKGNYKNGINYGDWIGFHPNGKIRLKVIRDYKNDSISKTTFNFYNEKEILTEKKIFTQGKEHYTSYYENGIVYENGELIKRKKEGIWKRFNSNNKIDQIITYKNNERNGIYQVYTYNNEVLREIMTTLYKNGIKEGEFTVIDDKDIVRIKGFYKNGEQDGEWVNYDSDGKIVSSETFKNGKLIYKENPMN